MCHQEIPHTLLEQLTWAHRQVDVVWSEIVTQVFKTSFVELVLRSSNNNGVTSREQKSGLGQIQ